jgi:maltodextrin utilization protein YvdJ|tara:strand:+ start:24215 stop:24427 length:213 start_codon:yes stop_codon:yes gene_type:complete
MDLTEDNLKPIIDPLLRKLADEYVKKLNENGIRIQDLKGKELEDAKKMVNILIGSIDVYIEEAIINNENQ